MIREHVRDVSEGEGVTLVDVDGDELFIYEADGHVALGIVTTVNGDGFSVLLDEPGMIRLIEELSRRLAARTERLEAKVGEALARGDLDAERCPCDGAGCRGPADIELHQGGSTPVERPIAEMSREEIREELMEIALGLDVNAMNDIESGRLVVHPIHGGRALRLGNVLRQRAVDGI